MVFLTLNASMMDDHFNDESLDECTEDPLQVSTSMDTSQMNASGLKEDVPQAADHLKDADLHSISISRTDDLHPMSTGRLTISIEYIQDG